MLKKDQDFIFKNSLLLKIEFDICRVPSASDVLDYVIECDDYSLIKYKRSKKTIINRLNMLWVWPLFLLLVPFQWLLMGDTGFKRESLIGKKLNKLVAYDE